MYTGLVPYCVTIPVLGPMVKITIIAAYHSEVGCVQQIQKNLNYYDYLLLLSINTAITIRPYC